MNMVTIRDGIEDEVCDLVQNFSIEALPRDTQKIDDLAAHLPLGTRVYVAHTSGSTAEIVEAAEWLRGLQARRAAPAGLGLAEAF